MSKQMFTSKNTAINVGKDPIVFKMLNYKKLADSCMFETNRLRLLNYGSGRRHADIKKYLEETDLSVIQDLYDPYWVGEKQNERALYYLKHGAYDIVICANVLNVLKEEEQIKLIIDRVKEAYVSYVFQIYEGDKTGIGRQTKKDCWQRNEKTREYLRFFPKNAVVVRQKFITNRPEFIL